MYGNRNTFKDIYYRHCTNLKERKPGKEGKVRKENKQGK
jgi:hypothetical protein